MDVKVYRDCDAPFHIRKVVIEISEGGAVVDRSRMFAGILFAHRLPHKIAKALARATLMIKQSTKVVL